MAINIYNKTNTIDIDSIDVLDFILKQNTITYLGLEVIFNCDIKQIIDKYSFTIELVNPSTTSTVYAQFTPSISDLGTTKNTISIGATPTTYGSAISYFATRYINKNHFKINNFSLTSNSPLENNSMQLQITINGVKKLFGTKTFASFSNLTGSLTDIFGYLQTYNISSNGFYIENTDIVAVKINNSNSAFLTVGTINNQSNTPLRLNNKDFVYNATSIASFSGSNSYALTKNYEFKTKPSSKLIIKKSPTDIERILKTDYLEETTVGCTKQFDLTLKNASSVSDTVYLEFPLLKELYTSGLTLDSVKVKATPNKVSFASTPVILALGGAKWKIDMSYAQTGEAVGTVATYAGEIELDFSHSSGNFTLKASGFTYTNSNT
jgi:hypothetical protein